jgi:hypothetical protein
MTITAKRKREMQADGVKFGCHCDLDEGEEPDECYIDLGRLDDCIYAPRHRTREGCPYWREVVEIEKGGIE